MRPFRDQPDRQGPRREQYRNTTGDASKIAATLARRYRGRRGGCQAACETTANMWYTTYDAFEGAGIPIKLANTYKMTLISRTAKTDRVDAEKIAQALRMGIILECYVPPAKIGGGGQDDGEAPRQIVQDMTRAINRIHGVPGRHNITVRGAVYAAKSPGLPGGREARLPA